MSGKSSAAVSTPPAQIGSNVAWCAVGLFVVTVLLHLMSHNLLAIYAPALSSSIPISAELASMIWPWTSASGMGAVMLSQMTGRLKRCTRPFRVLLSVCATASCILYLWPSPNEDRLVTTQLLMMVYVGLQVIGCLRILSQPQSLMADSAIATFTPWHFALGWVYLVWRVPSTVPIVLGEALMTGVLWVSVYVHFCADSHGDSFLNPAPPSLKLAVVAGGLVGAPVFHVVSSIAHNVFFAPASKGMCTLWEMCTGSPNPNFHFFQVNNFLFWSWYFGLCGALCLLAIIIRVVTKKPNRHPKKSDDATAPLLTRQGSADKVANGALEFTARG